MAKKGEATLVVEMKTKGKKTLENIGAAFGKMKVAAAAASAAIVGTLAVSLDKYADQEKAVNTLEASLKSQGFAVQKLSVKYQKLASSIQTTTTFGDEEILQAQALGQSLAGQIPLREDLIRATIDFAAANAIDLKSAFNTVGKSIGSSMNALGRYGVQLKKGASRTEKMDAITKALNKSFKGSAAAQAKGLGKVKQLSNAFGDFLELIGKQLSPAVSVFAEIFTDMVSSWDPKLLSRFFEDISIFTINTIASLEKFTTFLGTIPDTIVATGRAAAAAMTLDFSKAGKIMETNSKKVNDSIEKIETDRVTNVGKILAAFDDQRNTDRKSAEIAQTKIVSKEIEKTKVKTFLTEDEIKERKQKTIEDLAKEKIKTDKETARQEKENNKEVAREKKEQQTSDEREQTERIKTAAEAVITFTQTGLKGLTQGVLSFFAEKFIPGTGKAVQGIFGLMTSESEAFEEKLNQMFSTEFVNNFTKNFISMINRLPDLVSKAIATIGDNSDTYFTEMISSLINFLPNFWAAVAKGLIEALKTAEFRRAVAIGWADGMAQGIKDASGTLTREIRKAVKQAFEIGQTFDPEKGRGIGGSVFRTVATGGLDRFFAHGGMIPQMAHGGPVIPRMALGGAVDNTLIAATPGEFMVNKNSAAANLDLLESINNSNGRAVGGGGGGITIVVNGGLLGDESQARQFAKAVDEELFKLRQGSESRSFDEGLF